MRRLCAFGFMAESSVGDKYPPGLILPFPASAPPGRDGFRPFVRWPRVALRHLWWRRAACHQLPSVAPPAPGPSDPDPERAELGDLDGAGYVHGTTGDLRAQRRLRLRR